jgi:hypothetical protein
MVVPVALARVRVKVQIIPASKLDTEADPDPPTLENTMWPVSLQRTRIGWVAGPIAHDVEWNCRPRVGSPGCAMAAKRMRNCGTGGGGMTVAPAGVATPKVSVEHAAKARAPRSRRRVDMADLQDPGVSICPDA